MKRIRKRYRKAGNSGFNRLLALMLALAVCLSVTGVAVAANSIGSSPKALAVMPNGETVEISPNSVKPNAYIDAKWLDFVCQTAIENPDSEYESDLNNAGKAALTAEYGGAKIPSGHLEGTAPEEVNQNGEYHAFINAEVGGVQIHSIGILEIDGTEYVYYTTNSTQPTCAVYNVLRPDDNGMPANKQEKITLNYKHMQGQLIRYNVKDDETSPAGVGNDEVFGAHPTLTTAEDGTVAFPVTIPRGYKATVTAWFVEGKATSSGSDTMNFPEGTDELDKWKDKEQVKINSDMIAKPSNEGYSQIILGEMQSYEWEQSGSNSWDYKSQMEGYATSSLTSTITVVQHEHKDAVDNPHKPGKTRLYVVVSLEKTDDYTFSAVDWLLDSKKGNTARTNWDFGKMQDNQKQGETDPVLTKGKAQIDENGSATWTIRSVTTFKSGEGGDVSGALNDGYTAWALTLLEINGEQVDIPALPEFSNADYPLGNNSTKNSFTTTKNDANERFAKWYDSETNTVSRTEETILSSGTKITITVVGELLKAQGNVIGKPTTGGEVDDCAYFRTYTVKIENCQENLTVTTMNFSKDISKELILSSHGVTDVQVYSHPQWSTNESHEAYWQDVTGINGRIVDRNNSRENFNWYTDPIRFKREEGYMPAKIVFTDSMDNKLWESGNSTPYWLDLPAPYELKGTGDNGKVQLDEHYYQMYEAGELLVPKADTSGAFTSNLIDIIVGRDDEKANSYVNNGFKWRRACDHDSYYPSGSYNPIFYDYYDVISDEAWKKDDNTKLIAWYYSDWINLDKTNRNEQANGFFYFRTTEALDRYMYTEGGGSQNQNDNSYDANRGKVYVDIIADPILVNVDYESNEGATGTPSTGAVQNMPEDDNSGYNVEDNRTVLISPLIPQAKGYAFQHWELWVGDTQITDEDGNPITFTPSQSVTINEALELALQGQFDLNNLKDNTVTVTLKAFWKTSEDKTAVNYDVNFWIPAETAADVQDVSVDDLEAANLSGDKKWYSIREDIHQVVDGRFVVADLYAETGGGLSQHVLNTLNGAWSSGSTDYTKNGDLQYVVATGGDLTPKPAEWTVNSKEAPPGKNYPVNIYLKVDDTVNVTVTKTWQGSDGVGADTALDKPNEVYVRLQRTTAETTDESIVWSSEGINNAEQKLTPAQAGDTAPGWTYTWEKLPGKDDSGNVYTYRVVELTKENGNVIAEGGTLTTDDVDYTVSYGSGTAKPDPNDSKVLNAGITNQEKAANLVISKQVTGKFGDVTKPFTFTVTLTDKDGNAFVSDEDISVQKVEVKDGQPGNPTPFDLDFDGNGQATFTLKHNESLTIKSLPAGTQYTVEENVEKAEYTTKYVTKVGGGDAGEPGDGPAGGTMSGKDVAVEVTNSKVDIALTGLRDTTSSGLLMTMAAVLLGTAIVSVSLIKRRVKGNWK